MTKYDVMDQPPKERLNMRNISFALTTAQIRARTKFVTRRLGWKNLKPGTLLQAVVKSQGLKKGEHPEKLCVIRVVEVSRQPLDKLLRPNRLMSALEEMDLEGFAMTSLAWPANFVKFFCNANKCAPEDDVTRIRFEYVD